MSDSASKAAAITAAGNQVDFDTTIIAQKDPSQGFPGYQRPQDVTTEFSAYSFIINQAIGRLNTVTLVTVTGITPGGTGPVGFVNVQPLVNQVDGAGNPTPHGIIYNIPYLRYQGGTNAIIMDPVVGDNGIALFCSRDISTVKRTKAAANPGSSRRYDWADGLYIGGLLNAAPQQYIQFTTSGITITTPQTLTINAQTVNINANVNTTGTLNNNNHAVGSTHLHTNSGGTGLGGPPQ